MATEVEFQEMVLEPSELFTPLLKVNFRTCGDFVSITLCDLFISLVSMYAFEFTFALLFSGISFLGITITFGVYWAPLSENLAVFINKVKRNVTRIDIIVMLARMLSVFMLITIFAIACSGHSVVLSHALIEEWVALGVCAATSSAILITLYLIVFIRIRKFLKSAIKTLIKR